MHHTARVVLFLICATSGIFGYPIEPSSWNANEISENLAIPISKAQDETCRLVLEGNYVKYLLIDALNDTSTCGTPTRPLEIVNPSNFTIEIIHYDLSPDTVELSRKTPHEVEITDPLASEKVLLANGLRDNTGKFNFKSIGSSVALNIKRGVNDSLSRFLLRVQVDGCPALSNDKNLTMRRDNSNVTIEDNDTKGCIIECKNGTWVGDFETCERRARNDRRFGGASYSFFCSLVGISVTFPVCVVLMIINKSNSAEEELNIEKVSFLKLRKRIGNKK